MVTEHQEDTTRSTDSESDPLSIVCRTKLLSDDPESNDAFGPHQRIAQAIAGLILPGDAKGLAIGLEGSWGSGKSTVARLLEKLIEGNKEIALINFDAWAHEGDPLRRTFLENLIRKLQRLEWIDKEKWDLKVDELAKRRERVTTKDTLILSQAGKWVGFTILLVPIGGAFVSAALREDLTLIDTGNIAYKFLILLGIGLLLSFSPLIAVLAAIQNSDVIGLLFNKGVTEKTTETSKTVNPTSIEFEETFNAVIDEALENKNRKLVLLLDNLDRVESNDALAMWSTLQTFLRQQSDSDVNWRARLWTLILYDPVGLYSLWTKRTRKESTAAAVSFIEKRFQVRFEVPAPVLSDWRSFLMDRLKEAFEDHDDSDHHDIYRVLEIQLTKESKLPTIRELKLYVNQIGSIHRQWATGTINETTGTTRDKDEFRLGHIAYYVLLRQRTSEIVKEVLNQKIIDQEYEGLLGIEVRDSILALALNVEINLARQLLFSNKIREALVSGSGEELNKVKESLPRGFWEIVEQALTTSWSDAPKVADAAFALEESQLLTDAYQPTIKSVTKRISDIAQTATSWFPLNEQKARGLAIILKWKTKEFYPTVPAVFIVQVFSGVASAFRDEALQHQSALEVKGWLENLKIPLNDLQTDSKIKAFETIVEKLGGAIQGKDALDTRELGSILELLSELRGWADANFSTETKLRALVDAGQVSRQLQLNAPRTPSTVAWCVFTICRYASKFDTSHIGEEDPPSGRSKLSALLSDPTGAIVENFVRILERYEQLPILFDFLTVEGPVKAFFVGALSQAIKGPRADVLFESAPSIERLRLLFREIGDSEAEAAALKDLIQRVPRDKTDLVAIVAREEFNAADSKLYYYVFKNVDASQLVGVKGWLEEGLKKITSEDWLTQINEQGSLLNLSLELQQKRLILSLGQNYFDALAQFSESILWGFSGQSPTLPRNPSVLLGTVNSPLRQSFGESLFELVSSNEDEINRSFFDVFGPEMTEHLLSGASGPQALELFHIVLKRKLLTGLVWIKSTLAENAQQIEVRYSDSGVFKSFKRQLQKEVTGGHQEALLPADLAFVLMNIAESLNVKPLMNGQLAFTRYLGAGSDICCMDEDGTNERILTDRSKVGDCSQPSWSPDGKRIAFVAKEAGGTHIWLMNGDGSNQVRITHHARQDSQPSWSPDGRRILFVRLVGKASELRVLDLESSKDKKVLSKPMHCEHPVWSPDGQTIAFHSLADKTSTIFLVSADGTDWRQPIVSTEVSYPSWSPDGNKLAFIKGDRIASGVFLIDLEGKNEVRLVDEADTYSPSWSPDGKKVVYQIHSGESARLEVIDVDGTHHDQLSVSEGFAEPSWQSLNRLMD